MPNRSAVGAQFPVMLSVPLHVCPLLLAKDRAHEPSPKAIVPPAEVMFRALSAFAYVPESSVPPLRRICVPEPSAFAQPSASVPLVTVVVPV